MTGRLLTARKVADRLDFSSETILRWTRRGDLDGVVVYLPGGALRYREDELELWLAERATPERGGVEQPRWTPPTAERTLARVEQPQDEED